MGQECIINNEKMYPHVDVAGYAPDKDEEANDKEEDVVADGGEEDDDR